MSIRSRVREVLEKTLGREIIAIGQVALVFEWQHLRRFFKHFAIDCVFDVGANAGQYARMLRRRAGFRGHIISYEPIPELAVQLRKAAASDSSWTVEELTLDEIERDIALNVFNSDRFSSLHAISAIAQQQFGSKVQLARRIELRTTTLAAELIRQRALIGFQRPFLKMDTQGHDLAVARGAGASLREFLGLQSELAIKPLYEGAPRYDEAIAFYRSQGFELSAFVPNNLGHFPRLLETDCIMYRH